MKTIFQLSRNGIHFTAERDRDGNVTFSMEMSGEWHEPTIKLVPTEVSALNRILGDD